MLKNLFSAPKHESMNNLHSKIQMSKAAKLRIEVMKGTVLGVTVYRGYAPLSDLARISRADIYDQVKNPSGTQRDLSPKHARDAYHYVRDSKLAYWAEVFLCARDGKIVSFKPVAPASDIGLLTVDLPLIQASKAILISRIDGNHRLHFADGHEKGLPPIDKLVSFCLAMDLTLEDEISLFRDINNNQKRMNTSHLDNIQTRLLGRNALKFQDPELFIAQKLSREQVSPLRGLVFEGGTKESRHMIPLRTLKSGIEYMMSRPTKLTALKDADAQFKVISNYFSAVRKLVPEAWDNPKDYLLLRGAGLWGICFLGADVIDRSLGKGAFDPTDMLRILQSGKKWDWTNGGDFQGYSGRSGALKISEAIANEFVDDSAISVRDLYKRIMGS